MAMQASNCFTHTPTAFARTVPEVGMKDGKHMGVQSLIRLLKDVMQLVPPTLLAG
jgi:hypothetical protein